MAVRSGSVRARGRASELPVRSPADGSMWVWIKYSVKGGGPSAKVWFSVMSCLRAARHHPRGGIGGVGVLLGPAGAHRYRKHHERNHASHAAMTWPPPPAVPDIFRNGFVPDTR